MSSNQDFAPDNGQKADNSSPAAPQPYEATYTPADAGVSPAPGDIELEDVVDNLAEKLAKAYDFSKFDKTPKNYQWPNLPMPTTPTGEPIEDAALMAEYYSNLPQLKTYLYGLFCEGDMVCLYGCPNVGKTAFSLYVAEIIAAQTNRLIFYFDFEMSGAAFYRRAFLGGKPHPFAPNLKRIPMEKRNNDAIEAIRQTIDAYHPELVVIDNLSNLESKQEDAAAAITMLQSLRDIAHATGTTMLLLAHTTKYKEGRILALSDIRGSGMIAAYIDDAFCLCASRQGNDIIAIKQTKSRLGNIVTAGDNVFVARKNSYEGLLSFAIVTDAAGAPVQEPESAHVFETPAQQDKANNYNAVCSLMAEGLNTRQISISTGIPYNTVKRYVQKARDKGQGGSSANYTA